MSKIERSYLCVHGHFSQPPRAHPLDDSIAAEPDAAPFQHWLDRITQTCYRPNAERGNFRFISYSFSEAVSRWLEASAPETYAAILQGDRSDEDRQAESPAGNGLATAYNHIILPLARKRDKYTQIYWGIAAFEHRYGRKPLGFWLPEMAVDTETLRLLAEAGIRYTLLAQKQFADLPEGRSGGPFRVELDGDHTIAVFARDDELSSQISFNIHNLGGAGHWSQAALAPMRKSNGGLVLLATSGETFGHHFAGEEEFLYWLMHYEAPRVGFQTVTLDRYFLSHPPSQTVHIEELSSWGEHRGLSHWATGYADQHLDTTWKGALRRALDNVASEIDRVYEELLLPYGINPWKLRNQYAAVLLGAHSADDFMSEQIPGLKEEHRQPLTLLFKAQELAQRMYNSYTFTDNRLDSRQPRYAVGCAAAALSLAQQATGRELAERFPLDMAVVTSASTPVTGSEILRQALKEFGIRLD